MLQQSPSDLAALSNRGYAFRKLGKFAAASEDYTAALKQSPGTVRLYNNRGYCLAKLGKYKSAIQDYQRVIQLDPANAHAYHNRGISFDKLGQFEQVIPRLAQSSLLQFATLASRLCCCTCDLHEAVLSAGSC